MSDDNLIYKYVFQDFTNLELYKLHIINILSIRTTRSPSPNCSIPRLSITQVGRLTSWHMLVAISGTVRHSAVAMYDVAYVRLEFHPRAMRTVHAEHFLRFPFLFNPGRFQRMWDLFH